MILDDETMVENPLASVVICTRNRGELIGDTIKTVLANTYAQFELLIIDQSTNLVTENAAKKYASDKRLRYIHTDTIGTGISRYMGLVEAKGEIVLYTDDDCRVPSNWIETVSEIFSKDEMIGMVFCNVVAGPHNEQSGFVPTYVISQDYVAHSIKDKPKARGIGAGMAVRRQTALAIGGFDILLGPGSPIAFPDCEDGDMAVRMLIKGWWVYETSKIAVIHDGFRTWEEGKELSKRNSLGIGAAYSKPIKAGHWQFMPTVLFEGIFLVLLRPLASLLKLKKPHGLRRFVFFWNGFFLGLKVPIDDQKLVFLKE